MENRRDAGIGKVLLTLILMGISLLFAGLVGAYLYTLLSSASTAPRPPVLFLINIPVLMTATVFLRKARSDFDLTPPVKYWADLTVAGVLSVIFTALQITGWVLFFGEFPLQAGQLTSFVYVLSALHLLHVIGGLPFLIWLILRTRNPEMRISKGVEFWRAYLHGLGRYWRFLDILWVLLVAALWTGFLFTEIT